MLEGITSALMQPDLGTSNSSNKNSERGLVCGMMSVNICLKAGVKSLHLFGRLCTFVLVHIKFLLGFRVQQRAEKVTTGHDSKNSPKQTASYHIQL